MEVEVKFRLSEDVRDKVERCAKFLRELVEEDVYFSHPCRDFRETDEALRVRKSDGIYITYKGPKVDDFTKTREEIEVGVDSYEVVEILKRLGFSPVAKIRKRRRIYNLGDVNICLDSVEGLGEFIEIEVKCDDVEIGRRKVLEVARELGLKESITKSYLEMLLEKT